MSTALGAARRRRQNSGAGQIEYLVLTNIIYPYHRHNISILSLPAGIPYRFRYETKYLEESDAEVLQGKLGVLVLFDRDRKAFIPLRAFRFFRVENFGSHVFLELEFLHFVKYELGTGRTAGELQAVRHKYSKDILQVLKGKAIGAEADEGISKLLVSADPTKLSNLRIDDGSKFEETLRYWSAIVTLLGGIEHYAKTCFYLIAAIRDIASDEKATLFESEKRKGFKLYGGRTYLMQVYQLMSTREPPPMPGYKIELQNISQHILPLRSSEIVDGSYDRLEFLFYVLPQEMRRVNSFMAVENTQPLTDPKTVAKSQAISKRLEQILATPGEEKSADTLDKLRGLLKEEVKEETSQIPPTLIELRVTWTKWETFRRWILSPLIGLFAAAVYYSSKAIGEWVGQMAGIEAIKPEFIQVGAVILLAVAAGNLATFTGAFKAPPVAGPKT